MYSVGVSEEVTGKALREFANLDECVIATKVFNPMSDRPNQGGLSRKHIVQGCEASLRRLGLQTIDLYQVHRFDPNTPIEEMLAGLDLLVRQGKVRYLGAARPPPGFCAVTQFVGTTRLGALVTMKTITTSSTAKRNARCCRCASPRASACCPGRRWHAVCWPAPGKRRRTPVPQTAAESDDFARKLYDQPSDQAVIDAVRRVAQARGISSAQVALAWLLAKPVVTAPIVGATKLHHLDDALAALDVVLSAEEIARLRAPDRPHPVRGF